MNHDLASSAATARLPEPAGSAVEVLLPLPLAGGFDYRVPAGMAVEPGSMVMVPFGRQLLAGIVWGPGRGDREAARLKDIASLVEVPAMTEDLRRLVTWVAGYTVSPSGAVLRMAMSVTAALAPPARPRLGLAAAPALPEGLRRTPARTRVLEIAADGRLRTAAMLAAAAGCSEAVVRGLASAGALAVQPFTTPRLDFANDGGDPFRGLVELGRAQRLAAAELVKRVRRGGFGVVLLDGVTGSGKTDTYFAAIAAAIAAGRQVLVLLPEIALGVEWQARFERRFGRKPAEWHSDLSAAERRDVRRAVAAGEAAVVVGARSALFLPFADLGLVIVDEEHDASFKQEEGVTYHARDMAVVRASLQGIPIVLVSATPSLETVVNVEQHRYARLSLPDRHGGALPPAIEAVDLRRFTPPRQRFLSPVLVEATARTLAAGEQVLLFLNRRGYAPLTLCRTCGNRLSCPNCTAWLVEHRLAGRLLCHHCGHSAPLPEICPECGTAHSFAPCGPGVERLAEEVAMLFPEARVGIMASDLLAGPRAAASLLAQIDRRELDLVIGTQMIAKGHHFPFLTTVGVVDGDLGLSGGDLRAFERTYQLLHQVAGRAGRAERPGTVYLQTYEPSHPVIRALVAGDRDGFYRIEAAARAEADMPPYGRLAALILSGPSALEADEAARALARVAPNEPGIEVLGPAPAPLSILRGRHRRRFLLKAPRDITLQPAIRAWLGRVKLPNAIRVQVDIDPYSFL